MFLTVRREDDFQRFWQPGKMGGFLNEPNDPRPHQLGKMGGFLNEPNDPRPRRLGKMGGFLNEPNDPRGISVRVDWGEFRGN